MEGDFIEGTEYYRDPTTISFIWHSQETGYLMTLPTKKNDPAQDVSVPRLRNPFWKTELVGRVNKKS